MFSHRWHDTATEVCLELKLLASLEKNSHLFPLILPQQRDNDARKMMFGLLFSLKQFVLKLQPFPHGSKTSSYLAFRTNNYKLHVSETASGLIFLLATEPSSPEMKEQLCQCARVYDDFISKILPLA